MLKTKKIEKLVTCLLGSLLCANIRAAGWKDFSTAEDGISPASCTDAQKECVFRHSETGQEITSGDDPRGGLGNQRAAKLSGSGRRSLQGSQKLGRS